MSVVDSIVANGGGLFTKDGSPIFDTDARKRTEQILACVHRFGAPLSADVYGRRNVIKWLANPHRTHHGGHIDGVVCPLLRCSHNSYADWEAHMSWFRCWNCGCERLQEIAPTE